MKTYKIKWWREPEGVLHEEVVVDHGYYAQSDRFFFEYEDGGMKEVALWSHCSLELGADWRELQRERASFAPHTLGNEVFEDREPVKLVVED